MKNIIGFIILLFGACFGLGFIVSKLEKKKGWVEGHRPYGIYEKHIKRPLDFALTLFALILFWPILLIIAIAVRINMGSPVVFSQERPGLGGEIFKIKKFRTMTDARDAEGKLLPDGQRLTRLGRWLRASSGDEGCEFINILKGEMACVGPRPQLVRDMVFMTDIQKKRHDVRSGLTGLAQVNGRNAITWEEKLDWDCKYVEKITFLGDVGIIQKTIAVVFQKKGITDGENETALDYGDALLKNGKISREKYDLMQLEAERILKEYDGVGEEKI